jgi:hypothetical protein
MFPARTAGFVFSLLMMAVDASAIVYAAFNYLHFHANVSIRIMFMALAAMCIVFLFTIRFIYPPKVNRNEFLPPSEFSKSGQLNYTPSDNEVWYRPLPPSPKLILFHHRLLLNWNHGWLTMVLQM